MNNNKNDNNNSMTDKNYKKDFFGKGGIDSASSRYASDVLEKKLTRGGSFLGTDVRNNHHMNNARSDNNFKNDINNNKNDNNNSMTNKNNKNNNFKILIHFSVS